MWIMELLCFQVGLSVSMEVLFGYIFVLDIYIWLLCG